MHIVIGAPVYARAWILPYWFQAIEAQDFPMEDLGFVFVTGPNDMLTLHELLKFHARHPEVRCFDIMLDSEEPHVAHLDGHRHWDRSRYYTMAKFRNTLLDKVACYKPDRYLSLDTDVLLEDPTTISQLAAMPYDAVAPLMFMTPDTDQFPNVMNWWELGVQAYRHGSYPLGEVFRSDIIMAAVMMTPKVYTSIRYEYHHQGEDLGWSAACGRAGIELYSASNIYTPHIMSTLGLEQYLTIGDARGKSTEKSS